MAVSFGTFLCCHVREVPKIKIEVLQAFSNICKITGGRFMKCLKRITILLVAVIIITPVYSVTVYAVKDNKYVISEAKDYDEYALFWYNWAVHKKDKHSVILETSGEPCIGPVLVPDRINGRNVVGIYGSSVAVGFDVNPKNKYIECIDNVLFSKDKKTLMSYPRNNTNECYSIPMGTEIIDVYSMGYSDYLKEVIIPESVVNIEKCAFVDCDNLSKITFLPSKSNLYIDEGAFLGSDLLSEIILPSFNVQIDCSAFGYESVVDDDYHLMGYRIINSTRLTSYEQVKLTAENNVVKWDRIPNALYYKVYRKLSSGEYKLTNITSGTSFRLPDLKQGTEYTYAVKPVAVIPAANYEYDRHEQYFPETFTIEGTMSEDVVVKG